MSSTKRVLSYNESTMLQFLIILILFLLQFTPKHCQRIDSTRKFDIIAMLEKLPLYR